ncbi:MAG TPA: T9SS type A sorting domain-containing protein, partial [Candidatus Edwardsbacteria bacterium]|nr:T9SS type A sorting domain-containing protein [Candidatus Edwardsbacteria bacterium]
QPGDSANNAGAPFAFSVLPTATMPEGHRVKLALEECIYSAASHDTVRTLDSVIVTVGSPTVIFSDNFEAGRGLWVVGKVGSGDTTTVNWDTTSADCHSPGYCVTDSRWGNYKRGIFRYIAMAESVDLTPFASVTAGWWEKFATQPSLDQCRPMYSANSGKNWNTLDTYSGTQASWRQRSYSIANCDTIHGYKLRFMMTSNTDTITADGWYVDDVTIMGYTKASGVSGDPAGQRSVRGIAVGCYPNPSPGVTMFNYSLPRAGRATLALYDICGRQVTTLIDAPQQAGGHSVRWNGAGRDGRRMPSGVYFYRLDAGGRSATGKLILIK